MLLLIKLRHRQHKAVRHPGRRHQAPASQYLPQRTGRLILMEELAANRKQNSRREALLNHKRGK